MEGDLAEPHRGTEVMQTFSPDVAPTESLNEAEEVPEKEDEEDICRICHVPGTEDLPLYYPCACRGSMKFIHEDCLLQWLDHKIHVRGRRLGRGRHGKERCEICEQAFAFQPVYADNTPSRLPLQEVLSVIAERAARGMHLLARQVVGLSVWLLGVPLATLWIWRCTFVRSLDRATVYNLFNVTSLTPGVLYNELSLGLGVWAGLAAAMLTFEFMFGEVLQQWVDEHLAVEDNGQRLRAGGQLVEELVQRGPVPRRALAPLNRALNLHFGHWIRDLAWIAQQGEWHAFVLVAEDWGFHLLHMVHMRFIRFAYGLRRSIFESVKAGVTVWGFHAIFLAFLVLFPFTLGRVVLSIYSLLSGLLSLFTYGGADRMLPNLNTVPTATGNLSSIFPGSNPWLTLGRSVNALAEGAALIGEQVSAKNPDDHAKETVMVLGLLPMTSEDITALTVGYGVILLAWSLHRGHRALLRYREREGSVQAMAARMAVGVKYTMSKAKVALVILFKHVLLILFYGWWLDICTLRILDVSLSQRMEFFQDSPLRSSLHHWIVGLVYKLHTILIISRVRQVLRPGVLYFLEDPTDQVDGDLNYNPFRSLVDTPLQEHALQILFSVVIHGSSIVMQVLLPTQLAMFIAPVVFPLRPGIILRSGPPISSISAAHLWITLPRLLSVARGFRAWYRAISRGISHWISIVGWALGLQDFLLPNPEGEIHINDYQQPLERGPRVPEGPPEGQDYRLNRNPAQASQNEQTEGAEQDTGQDKSAVDTFETDHVEGEQMEGSPQFAFLFRIGLLLIAACVTIIAIYTAIIFMHIAVGRSVLSVLGQTGSEAKEVSDDMDAIFIGWLGLTMLSKVFRNLWRRSTAAVRYLVSYRRVLWRRTTTAVSYVMNLIQTHDDDNGVRSQALKLSSMVAKSAVLLALWFVVVGTLVGLLFELLVVLPIEEPIDRCPLPIFYLFEDWVARWFWGSILLVLWTALVTTGVPFADESWELRFRQAWADGFANLRGFWMMKEIITPILTRLLMVFCVPLVLARWIFPSLGFSLIVNSAVDRFAWLGCLGMIMLWYGVQQTKRRFTGLHDSLRDDKYIIARKLVNFVGNA